MKVRTGFVSNSSTSSFIVVGYEFKRNYLTRSAIEKMFPNDDYGDASAVFADHEEHGARPGRAFFGIEVASSVDEVMTDVVMDVEDARKRLATILDGKLNTSDLKLCVITGTKCC